MPGQLPVEQPGLPQLSAAVREFLDSARGIATSLFDAVCALARRSIERGHGHDGFPHIVEEIAGRRD